MTITNCPPNSWRMIILALLLKVSLCPWLLIAADSGQTESWFGEKAKSREFIAEELAVFKANARHPELSDKIKGDLKKLGTERVEAVEFSKPEQVAVKKQIEDNHQFEIVRPVDQGGYGKAVVESFAFGRIGNTKICVVCFKPSQSKGFEAYLIEKSPSKWLICGTGISRRD